MAPSISSSPSPAASAGDPPGRHRPGVEVRAGPARGRLVKARVDVVGAGLRAAHGDAAVAQRPQQPQHHRGLAGPRSRRGQDQAPAHALSRSAPRPSGSRLRGASPLAWRLPVEHLPHRHRPPDADDRRRLHAARPPDRRRARASVVSSTRSAGSVASVTTATGSAAGPAGGQQRRGDPGDVLHPHVDHQHLAAVRDRLPVQRRRRLAGLVVAGDEGDRLVHVAVGDRDAGIGQPADAGRDAGDDADRDAVRGPASAPLRRRGRRRRDRRPSAAAPGGPAGPDRPASARCRAVWPRACRRACRHRAVRPAAPSRGSTARPARRRRSPRPGAARSARAASPGPDRPARRRQSQTQPGSSRGQGCGGSESLMASV